jgi:hypothetical protein
MKRTDLVVGQDYGCDSSNSWQRRASNDQRVTLIDLGPFVSFKYSPNPNPVTAGDESLTGVYAAREDDNHPAGYGLGATGLVAVKTAKGRVQFVAPRELKATWAEYAKVIEQRDAQQKAGVERRQAAARHRGERYSLLTAELARVGVDLFVPRYGDKLAVNADVLLALLHRIPAVED